MLVKMLITMMTAYGIASTGSIFFDASMGDCPTVSSAYTPTQTMETIMTTPRKPSASMTLRRSKQATMAERTPTTIVPTQT